MSKTTGDVAAEADAAMVTVDYSTGKPVRVPGAVRAAIGKLEGRALDA